MIMVLVQPPTFSNEPDIFKINETPVKSQFRFLRCAMSAN